MQNWLCFFTQAQFKILSITSWKEWFILEKDSSAYISMCLFAFHSYSQKAKAVLYNAG